MTHIHILNPLEVPDWENQILTFPDSSIFHSAAWTGVLVDTYDYRPCYVVSREKDKIRGVIPVLEVTSPLTGKRGVSLPFTDACPPLVRDNETFSVLLNYLLAFGKQRGWKYLELRGEDSFVDESPPKVQYYRHRLSLKGKGDKNFGALHENHRRNVRRAEKEGVGVEIVHSEIAVQEFRRLNTLTRRRHGLPPQPSPFFDELYRWIISRGLGFVALADYQGKKVAGAIFLTFGDRVVYKYGASEPIAKNLGANHLVMWKAICFLSGQGYQELDFGRTDFGQEGLRRFKTGWGAEESRITYRRYDFKSGTFQGFPERKANFSEKVMSRLPYPLLTLIGRLVYRHFG